MKKTFIAIVILTTFLMSATGLISQTKDSCRNTVAVEFQKIKNLEFTGWESGETLLVDSLKDFKPKAVNVTAWGGRRDLPLPEKVIGKSGFFRLAQVKGRWYFVDPDDGLLVLAGIQGLGEYAGIDNEQEWATQTAHLLRDNGFNSTAFSTLYLKHYSDIMPAGIGEKILDDGNQKMSYVDLAFMLRSFVWKINMDDKNFNRLMAIFHPDYLKFIDEYARENCKKIREDKHCIGYYIDNELGYLGWRKMFANQSVLLKSFLGMTDAKNTVALPEKYSWARNAALEFLSKRGVLPENITDEDDDAFRAYVADYYYRTTTEALRRYDSNHLILGNRLHGFSKYDKATIEACARWCDVISINYYNEWTPETGYMENIRKWTSDKPFIVTEFYVKGDDAAYNHIPYENKEGGGWLVRTQADRGRFYQNFTLNLLRAQNCAGWIHFKYGDTKYKSKSGNEAYCNKGIVDFNFEPYTDFLKYVKQVNVNTFSLIDYFDTQQ